MSRNSGALKEACGEKKTCYEIPDDGWELPLAKASRELFVENLNRLMRDSNAKNIALARFVGVAPSGVTFWRTGKMMPEVDKLSRIAEFFHVPTAELFRDLTDDRTLGVDLTDVNEILETAIRSASRAALRDLTSQLKRRKP